MRFCFVALFLCISGGASAAEHWPAASFDRKAAAAILEQFDSRYAVFHDTWYRDFIADYHPFGDYLNYGTQRIWVNDGEVQLGTDGMPKIMHEGKPYYNPVTIAQYALSMYAHSRKTFLAAADKLISLQSKDGAFRYPIRLSHHADTLQPGWVSAMAQGQALSVFARAVNLTNEKKYLDAGRHALAALLRPITSSGGTTSLGGLDRSLANYTWFAEYPSNPVCYTLNGYMFTLLGLYDWSRTAQESKAGDAFRDGMRTLEHILPLYDVDGFSAYDLKHALAPGTAPNLQRSYEGIHVYLLHALYSIAPRPILKQYEKKWADKIEEMNKPVRFTKTDLTKSGSQIEIALRADSSEKVTPVYEIGVEHDGQWQTLRAYSPDPTFSWTPPEPGHYDFGLYTKRDGASDYENFRVVSIDVKGTHDEAVAR